MPFETCTTFEFTNMQHYFHDIKIKQMRQHIFLVQVAVKLPMDYPVQTTNTFHSLVGLNSRWLQNQCLV